MIMSLSDNDESCYESDLEWWEWSSSHPSAAEVSKADRRGVGDQYVCVGGHLIVVEYHEDDEDYRKDDDEQRPGLEEPPVATFSDNPPPWEGWKPTHWTQVATASLIDQAW